RSPSRSRPKPRCRRRAARRARVRPSPLLYAAPATSTTAASSRVAWRRSPETLWQEALGRLLVVAEAEVHRLAKLRVGGPLGERDLRDEARLEPRDVAHARRVGEGRRRARERPEALREARQRALVEPRADLADEAQLRAGVRAEEERAEMRPGAAGGGVAADHELLLLLDLDLEPAPRAARLVRRCLLLRDQALEALLLRRAIGGEPVRRQAARREDLVRTRDRGVERGAPLGERGGTEIAAVDPQAIERGENDRNLSLLEELEARDQLAVEGDGFAVEKDRAHRQRADGGGNVGEARAARLSRPRDEAHVAAFLVREDAVAVVLLLVDPARAMEGLVDQGGEHRARAERDAVARAFAGRRAHPLTGWRARPLAFARDRGRA